MPLIACYCRVSTADQSLDRQLTSTQEYAEREFGADLGDLEIYRDKSTGTNTERSGYQEMIADATDGCFDAVVVHRSHESAGRSPTSNEQPLASRALASNSTSSARA